MTREQIIAAAMENDLVQFYALAFEAGRVAEREECAKCCAEVREGGNGTPKPHEDNHEYGFIDGCNESEWAIRARSTKAP